MYCTDLYSSSVVDKNYSVSGYTKTALLCGLLMTAAPNVLPAIAQPTGSIFAEKRGSDFYRILSILHEKIPTWSSVSTSVDIAPVDLENKFNYMRHSFELLKGLSFLEGDVQAEKEADAYFDSIPVKTRKVLVVNR